MTHIKLKYMIVLGLLMGLFIIQLGVIVTQHKQYTDVLAILDTQTTINTQLMEGIFELQEALNGTSYEPADGWKTR